MASPAPVRSEQSLIREGLLTGMIGAAVVALFYLGIDLVRGVPLLTPSALGEAFVLRDATASTDTVNLTAVALYTGVHFLAFAAFGLLVALLARSGERSSLVRYAILPAFLAFLIFFWGVLAVADEATRGLFPIGSVLTANLLASLAMGFYVWRHHPALRDAFQRAPLGATDMVRE
jgi:hypothetical protein